MEKSKELCDKANILPRLDLAPKNEEGIATPNGPHKVKILDEKLVMGTDYQTGIERQEMKYLFEEKGVKKTYSVPIKDKQNELHYLIQRMSEVEPGEEIILEAKKKGVKTYIDLKRLINNEEIQTTNEESGFEPDFPMEG